MSASQAILAETEVEKLKRERDILLAAMRDIEEWCVNAQRITNVKPYGLDVARAAIKAVS